jgi:hypothetical protein
MANRESRILQMDWRSLGYWPVWSDGNMTWEKNESVRDT